MFKKINAMRDTVADATLGLAAWSQTHRPSNKELQGAGRLMLVVAATGACTIASSQGLVAAINNATTLVKATIGFISIVGVLVGLGFVLTALMNMWKKHKDDRNDITWGGIVGQASAGAGCMALTWLAVQFVLTLGGSQSDIGRTLGS